MTYLEYTKQFNDKLKELDGLRAETWRMMQIDAEFAAIVFYNADKKKMQVSLTRNVAGVGYVPVRNFEDEDVPLNVIAIYLSTVMKVHDWEEGNLPDFPYALLEMSDEL